MPAARPRRVAAVLAVLAVGLIAVLCLYRGREPGRRSTIPDAAARSKPAVAPLMLEADRVAGRLLDEYPEDPRAIDVMAWIHYRFGQGEDALAWWGECLRLDPGFGPAYYWLGTVAHENGDFAQAADHFRRACELEPGSSSLPFHLAQSLSNAGRYEEAARVLEETLAAHPRSMASLALLGDLCVRRKEYVKARRHLETAVEIAPQYTNAYYALAAACEKLGDQKKAKEHLERFKALKAKDDQAFKDDLDALDDEASLRDDLANVYTSAAKVYLAHGDFSSAEGHLQKARELALGLVECRDVLLWLYEQQGRRREALAVIEELTDRAPESLDAQMTVGKFSMRLGEFDRAEAAFQKAAELTPKLAGGYAALANLYLQSGRKLPEAERLARSAVELEPAAKYYFLLAAACRKNGKPAEARRAAGRAVELEPANPQYRQAYDEIAGKP